MAIGGNMTATVQVLSKTGVNRIGEAVYTWEDAQSVRGWLDYSSGDAEGGRGQYRADLQESTHVFLCDYAHMAGKDYTPDQTRLVIGSRVYQVLLVDNPMERDHHWEMILKYLG